MPGVELIDVRVEVREADEDEAEFYLHMLDEDKDGVLDRIDAGTAAMILVEFHVVPAEPGLHVLESPRRPHAIDAPPAWDDIRAAIDRTLIEVASEATETFGHPVEVEDLDAA